MQTQETTAANESLREYLRTLTEFRRDNPGIRPPDDWKHLCMEDLVLTSGIDYTPAPLPGGIKLGTVKQCFQNAAELTLARRSDLTYVEGYATSGMTGMAVHHAWCVTKDGLVVDNTWRDLDTGLPQPGTAYIGIPLDFGDHAVAMLRYERWGVLDLWEFDFPAVRLGWDGFLADLHEWRDSVR